MNQCYMAQEQDAYSTPVCDGGCRVGFLFFLRMWNIDITSSIGRRGEQRCGAAGCSQAAAAQSRAFC